MTPVLTFKSDVTLVTPPTPAGSRLLGTLELAARTLGFDLEVTSGTDGHTAPDPHALGNAFDVRTVDVPPSDVIALYHWLLAALGPAFYLQYEAPTTPANALLASIVVVNTAATGEHLHLQLARGQTYPSA